MAPFSLASFTETLTLLMNTPLVPVDSSKAPRDVPLTEMPTPNRQARESRRQSNSSLSSGIHDESGTFTGFSHTSQTPSPLSACSSKELPPLPTSARHHSRVRFADDVDVEL